jgi:hypothetical protein
MCGVLALLDGLGTKVHRGEEVKQKITNFDKVDVKIKKDSISYCCCY